MLLRRENLIKEISDALALLELSTRNKGLIRLYDQNIISEYFVAKMLNIVFKYDLINLNTINRTYAAIDLGDSQRKICFQVTYTSKKYLRSKIEKTIIKFIDNNLYHEYDTLKFLFLGPKQKNYSKVFDTKGLFKFNPKDHILNLEDIIYKLNSLETHDLVKLYDLIKDEFHLYWKSKKSKLSQKSIMRLDNVLNEIESTIIKGFIVNNQLILKYHKSIKDILSPDRNYNLELIRHSSELDEFIIKFNNLPRRPGRIEDISKFINENELIDKIRNIRYILGDHL